MPSAAECGSAHGVISSPQRAPAASTARPAARSPRPGERRAALASARRRGARRRRGPIRCRRRTLPRRPARRPGRGRTPASASSHPIVRPPSRHSAFSGPCTLNGTDAGVDRLAEPQHGRVAGRVGGSPLAHVDPCAEVLEQAEHRRRRPSRARTRRAATHARAASVAAAIAALPHEAIASGRRCPVARPQRLGGDEVQQDRRPGAGPCGCRRRCRSRPSPTRSCAERRRSVGSCANGVTLEPGGELAASSGHARPPRSSRAAGRTPTTPGAGRSARTGSGSSSGAGSGADDVRVQDVVAVGGRRRGQVNGYGVATSTVVPQTAQRQPTITTGVTPSRRGVELGDHLVPHAEVAPQAAPERLRRGAARTARTACPAARPTCSSRG